MIRCLSMHSTYVCAHAGECCHAGWTIPVEEPLVAPLRLIGIHIGADRVLPMESDGACVFFEPAAGRLCRIHRLGGRSLLPSMCRQFPRVVVIDPRGASITLSHFCPTAAGLPFVDVPLAIVEAPARLALDGRLEGLDATNVLPPLLARDVLMDWAGYSAWEEAAVALFGAPHLEPECAVECLERATSAAVSWRPGRTPLSSAVRQAFATEDPRRPPARVRWGSFSRPVNAFLAAHAFASWAAYEPEGLRAVPCAVRAALAHLTAEADRLGPLTRDTLIEAMRATDLRLRHSTVTSNRESQSGQPIGAAKRGSQT